MVRVGRVLLAVALLVALLPGPAAVSAKGAVSQTPVVLFPAFHGIVSAHEFDSLGEDFEKKEDELFGDDGFEKMVDKVAGIEKQLGIYDLAQFTPR